MEQTLTSKKLQYEFNAYLKKFFLKNLTVILSIGLIVLLYYMYSDWTVRNSLKSVGTRIPSLVLVVVLLAVHLIHRTKYYLFKRIMFGLVLFSILAMMYTKCLIHLHEDALAPSVTGAILVVFLVSLDNKENTLITTLLYAIPIITFTVLLFYYGKPSSKEFFVIFDIYPITFIGFAINRIQYKLRYKLFKSNYLLGLEQNKTKGLYEETLLINKELERKNEELNISNTTKDKFFRIIAHDLKNPIGAVLGLTDLILKDKGAKDNVLYSSIKTVNKAIKHTYVLLENLLTWARIQNKAIEYKPKECNVFNLVDDELNGLKQVATSKYIRLENNVPADFSLNVDSMMVETIIRNLVTNAIKFSHKESIVEVKAEKENRNGVGYAIISVVDSGVGIAKDKIPELFKISNNTSTKGTENEGGTGLGLLLCKEFMELHKGEIKVESQLGKGSVFKCEFPL